MEERLKNIVKALEAFAKERGGDLAISFQNGSWSVALTWGREAPDSPMAGAQALGSAPFLEEALIQVVEEARVELPIEAARTAGPTWQELLGSESALLVRLGQLVFVWAKGAPTIKVVRAEPVEVATATGEDLELEVAVEIAAPGDLDHRDAEGFEAFCREFVGAGGSSITADEAANLFAAYTGGVVDSALFDSVTPKLEAIAGKELVP